MTGINSPLSSFKLLANAARLSNHALNSSLAGPPGRISATALLLLVSL